MVSVSKRTQNIRFGNVTKKSIIVSCARVLKLKPRNRFNSKQALRLESVDSAFNNAKDSQKIRVNQCELMPIFVI